MDEFVDFQEVRPWKNYCVSLSRQSDLGTAWFQAKQAHQRSVIAGFRDACGNSVGSVCCESIKANILSVFLEKMDRELQAYTVNKMI